MASTNQRPKFFQGQYLGADDLTDLSDYFYQRSSRHNLGLHSWGIATGLELVEQDAIGGGIDVFVQPGYAIDGYGRPVVVTEPQKLSGDLLVQSDTGLVPIWIRYSEFESDGVRTGFKVCECDEEFERINESFILEAGIRETIFQRQSGVILSGATVQDPREVLRHYHADADLICDGSVPFQQLPESGEDVFWLIPLGYVNWQAGAPGSFVARSDEQQRMSRSLRRQIGVITEDIHASNGVIRLKHRGSPTDGSLDNDVICQQHQIIEDDFDLTQGPLEFEDLVWVEGNLRIEGNARLFGSKLEFRDDLGEENDVPLYLMRSDKEGWSADSQDLWLFLGTEDKSMGNNRLIIGTENPDGSLQNKVIVTDQGKVAIGDLNPADYFQGADDVVIGEGADLGLTIASTNTGNIRFASGTGDEAEKKGQISYDHNDDSMSFGTEAEERVWITATGRVGVGTEDPKAGVHIVTGSAANLADSSGQLVINEIDDINLVMDGNEIQARNAGSTSTLYLQARGGKLVYNHHSGALQKVTFTEQGRIGIGVSNPKVPLHIVNGTDVTISDDSGFLLLGQTSGLNMAMDDNEIQARSNGAVSTLMLQRVGGDVRLGASNYVKDNGRVGIGFSNPAEKLAVRGNIKLGGNGELFAPGGVENLRIITGRIAAGDGATDFGSGFSSSRTSEGKYRITFDVAFPQAPAITVTPINSSADDNLPTIDSLSSNSFRVHFKDTTPSSEGDFQDTQFSFIAIGAR